LNCLRILLVGLLLCFINEAYSLEEGIRFYIEKDLALLSSDDSQAEDVETELFRLLRLCKANFTPTDTTTGKIYHSLSESYFEKRDFKSALDYKEKELLVDLYHDNKRNLGETYTRLGQIHGWLSSFYKSEEYHMKSLEIKRQIADHTFIVNYLGISNAHQQQGKYNLQKQYAEYALDVAKTPQQTCDAYVAKLSGHVRLGEIDEAYLILESLYEVAQDNNLTASLGSAYVLNGWLKLREADRDRRAKKPYSYDSSIALYKKGIQLIESTEDEFKDRRLAFNYSSLSNLYAKKGDYDTALIHSNTAINKAREFYNKEYVPDMGTLFSNFAYKYSSRFNINYRENPQDTASLSFDVNKAIHYQHEAIKCFIDQPNLYDPIEDVRQADLYGINLKWRCLRAYSDITLSYAHRYLQLGKNKKDLIKAERCQSKVIDLIDIMREEMSDYDTKIFWRKDTRQKYNDAVELSEWLGDINKVLYYIEKSKSILLLEELNHKDALKLVPEHLAYREKELRELISSNIDDKPFYYNQYNDFLDSLKYEYPAYYAYKFDNEPPNIVEIQNSILDDSTNLVMYHRTNDSLFTVNITSTTSELLHQAYPKSFNAQVDTLMSLVSNKDSLEYMSQYRKFLNISHSIYNTLVKPIKEKRKNTIVIGDGKIDFIPFDLLVSDTTRNHPRYMIQDHVISYANSVSVLRNKILKSENKFNNMLMVSPEKFDALGLTSLTQSSLEINSLKQIVKSKILEKSEASISNFKQYSELYDVIHFSSHSGLDQKTNEPWIAFQDSLISLNEIYKLNLNASLVSLSSCKSSDGKYQSGEGINSLARAFLFADASAVVGSLWNLNEVSGYTIFQDFYKNLKGANSKPEALRAAKIEFINNNPYKSPYHWAPLICIGNPEALHSNLSSKIPYSLLLGGGLLLFAFILFKIYKK
jgi:CHAT domain-containing protein